MIKQLLSFAAMAAVAAGAQAETLNMLPSLSNAAYDAETHTITFDSSWGWVNWWMGDKDYSEYDEFVIEFEPVDYTVQLAIEYADDSASATAQAQAGASVCTLTLSEEGKAHVKQIAIQNSEAGTLVLTAAYFQNAVYVDPTADIVLFEGNEDMADNWYPGLEIPKDKIIAQGAGSKLTINYTTTGDGVSYKLCSDWTNEVVPGFADVAGFNEQYSSVWTSANPITYTFTEADITFLQETGDSSFRISGGGDGFVITKVTLTPAPADTSAVEAIEAVNENASVDVYTITGQKVKAGVANGEAINGLSKGLYIIGGKKVIVR